MSREIKAAIIGGVFAVVAACVGGVFLLINTAFEGGFVITGPGIQIGDPQAQSAQAQQSQSRSSTSSASESTTSAEEVAPELPKHILPTQPSAHIRPAGITIPAGGTFSSIAGWIWICTGDFSVIGADSAEELMYDNSENTGLVLVLEQNSDVIIQAPYGGRCEPFSQEEKSNVISAKVSYLMNTEGCEGICSKVNVKELNTYGEIVRDYWRP